MHILVSKLIQKEGKKEPEADKICFGVVNLALEPVRQ